MATLNYNHLRYFWVIASEQNLTRAAERLHVSQSSLSIQLRKLEDRLGQALFHREGRRLTLTEAGRIALDYANTIFRAGDEMMSLMHNRPPRDRQILRVGSVATLSRNFQLELLRPFLVRSGLRIVLHSGSPRELLEQLQTHTLDLVLANRPAHRDTDAHWHSHLLNEQPVSLVGKPGLVAESAPFPEYLASVPLLLPGIESEIRSAFDRWLDRVCIRPNILAEVDDMAMLRLLARDSKALALVPRVVVRDELRDGILVECHSFAEIRECFYAITPARRFPNPLVRELVWPSGTPDIAT